ncbi:MAG: N-formylglutamate deformylase [Burkholderiales bacterium]|nr:N-formylglutamate deformylase [Burkholderiales bacterium]
MTSPALWRIEHGDTDEVPLIVNVPHAGTYLPPSIAQTLSAAGLRVPDTDWHVDKLVDFVPSLGATLMVATHSRIAVDLNRDPSGDALYPGASNTEICPTATFASEPIYRSGLTPGTETIAARVEHYWRPYQHQLAAEIARIKRKHGVCILLDAHSIVSEVPRFFAGKLPDLNLGSADGNSCAASLAQLAFGCLGHAEGFTAVHNGRFKGGFITRHYGDPADNVHALQLEMAQCCYMNETEPLLYDASRAAALKAILMVLVEKLMNWRQLPGAETKK